MKTLESFSQSTTMALVGNKDGHCYGMCAAMADYVMNHWNTLAGGSFLGPFLAQYVKERKQQLLAWANESETIQKVAGVDANRTASLHVALVDGGLGQNYAGVQVIRDGLVPKFTDLLHHLVLEERYRTSYPVNGMHREVYLYLIDYRVPQVKEMKMVNAGHAILLGMATGGTEEWQEIVVFDPNYGVMECDVADKESLDTWWTEYARSYGGMGQMQIVNVFDKNVI